jgi:hypothetical protein
VLTSVAYTTPEVPGSTSSLEELAQARAATEALIRLVEEARAAHRRDCPWLYPPPPPPPPTPQRPRPQRQPGRGPQRPQAPRPAPVAVAVVGR